MEKQIYTNEHSTENTTVLNSNAGSTRWARCRKFCRAASLIAGLCMSSAAGAYTVSGNVFLAPNGLPLKDTVGLITGQPMSSVMGQSLYVYVVNQGDSIIARTQVGADGTYAIPGLVDGEPSAVQLSSNYYELNGKVLFLGLPSNYYPVGEGDLPPGDLTPDYSFPLAQTSDVTVDFAFEERPNSTNTIIETYSWNSFQHLIVPPATFNGTDPEDGTYGDNLAGRTIDFYPATPAGATSIYYYDTLLDFAAAGSKITISNFDPTRVTLAYNGSATTRGFSYTVADNAGARPFVPTMVMTTVPLMVSMASFTGSLQESAAALRWTTANEKNNDHFIIERSTDGIHFTTIDQVASQAKGGNSDVLLSYTYTDDLAKANLKDAYYRLQAIAYNGTSTISRIVHIRGDQGGTASWNVYPNPATDHLNIAPAGAVNGAATILLSNAAGAVMISQAINANQQRQATLNLSHLPNGQYFLQVNGEDGASFNQQVTVLR